MSYIPLIARVDSLPPLPESVIELESLYADGNPDIDKIVKVMEADPSLTADILAKVNAPLYGFSKNIVSVLQAITLFGPIQIRSIVLNSSINRTFDIDLSPYGISTHTFSKVSMIQSELMFQWYVGIDMDIARNATPIAFLMETGKILIAKDIMESQKTKNFLADLEEYDDISYVENMHAMMTSAQVNALVFKHLNLNDTFSEVMSYLDDEYTDIPKHIFDVVIALRIVRTAVNIKEQFTETSIENAIKLLEENKLDTKVFKRIVKRLRIKYLE